MMRRSGKRGLVVDDELYKLFILQMSRCPDMDEALLAQAMAVLQADFALKEYIDGLVDIFAERLAALSSLSPMNTAHAAYALRTVHPSEAAARVIKSLLLQLSRSGGRLNAQDVSMLLAGLRNMTTDTPGVRPLLQWLSTTLAERGLHGHLSGQGVGMCLSGLQSMTSNVAEVRTLVRELARVVGDSRVTLNTQSLSMAVSGMRGMEEVPEVKALLAALVRRIHASPHFRFDAIGIGTCLNGLQRMTGQSTELRELLRFLGERIQKSNCRIDAITLSCAFHGLGSMDPTVAEVASLVDALTAKLAYEVDRRNVLGADCIGSVIFNLRGFGDTPAVRRLLIQLTRQLQLGANDFRAAGEVGFMLYGLQRMSIANPEVQGLVAVLPDKLRSVCRDLSVDDIGRALFGLRNCSLGEEWRTIVWVWLDKLYSYLVVASSEEITSLHSYQHLLLVFDSPDSTLRRSVSSFSLLLDWIRLKVLLRDNIERHTSARRDKTQTESRSRSERKVALQIATSIKDIPGVLLSFNEILFGFEADVVCRLPEADGSFLTFNFEVDGVHHKDRRKDYFCKLRDAYLDKIHGVRIVRIDAMCTDFPSWKSELETKLKHVLLSRYHK
jgi:hypothetical protein